MLAQKQKIKIPCLLLIRRKVVNFIIRTSELSRHIINKRCKGIVSLDSRSSLNGHKSLDLVAMDVISKLG